ncbi:glucoamylase family protein [Sphingomonas sp. IC4-52]|uniref:glucoamylase family protein n=1 Tax=Sphingomonas sp. IC4-52 TaxID=2887202 RepID=UPI001D11FB60|nr:glucoamylase family protein [Sphingomonas sp. IC4-52]MCC2978999.1 Tat pathway signal protein [Sphingomonas sp. IC4-52]
MLDRRTLLANTSLGLAGLAAGCADPAIPVTPSPKLISLPDFYEEIEYRTFRYFRDTVNPANGLIPDRWPSQSGANVAGVGAALAIWPIAVERGWISRSLARDFTLAALRFFNAAPQGDGATGMTGHRGFFYRLLDIKTGVRLRNSELSSIATTMLHLGMLFAAGWWNGDTAEEREIRRLGDDIVERAEWLWFQNDSQELRLSWRPEGGFAEETLQGYNEGMMAVLLALGSARHAAEDGAWEAWTASYPRVWRGEGDTRHLAYAPLAGHQLSHMWIDFRGIRDTVMRGAGFDYFENSRRATYANRAYCIANPLRWDGYSADTWGLTGCDGPGNFQLPFKSETRTFFGYSDRGPLDQPGERDDGTLAPAAALGSLPFAPEIVAPTARAFMSVPGLYREYGFLNAFNPSFRFPDRTSETGSINAQTGWMARDYRALTQAPILIQAANHRSEAVWKVMRASPVLRRGLTRAGFTGGWLD